MIRVRHIVWTVVALLGLALLVLWAVRLRIATSIVDRKLAEARVPAAFRITRIGPFLERLEDVRLGDPALPDLVARRLDVHIGYGLGGARVTGVEVDGVRLKATLAKDGLHLGALDRLMPASSGGKATLPDLDLVVHDTVLALDTPNGVLRATLVGKGNPAGRFAGQAVISADVLRLASCSLQGTEARLAIAVGDRVPDVRGPIRVAHTACGSLTLGAGTAAVVASSNPTFETVNLAARPSGFGGSAGPARFAGVDGIVTASGALGKLGITGQLGFGHLALSDIARRVAAGGQLPASVPVAPVAAKASAALARLLGDARGEAEFDAAIVGEGASVRLHRAALTGADGGKAVLTERGGIMIGAAGWRGDGDLALGGGALPLMSAHLSQASSKAPLSGTATLAPYRVGDAQLAVPALRFGWDGQAARFDGRVLIDGPLGAGSVRGLDVPVKGSVSRGGALAIDPGCNPVAFAALRQGGFTFDGARFDLCGQPVVSRTAAGMRIDANAGPIRLTGRTSSGTPVTVAAASLHATGQGLQAENLAATLGETHVAIARLEGQFAGGGVAGRYADASGAIANVPLNLSNAAGDWRFASGALTLGGGLTVSDAAPSPRFLPMQAEGLRFALANNTIDATAALHEPKSQAKVADVAITHRLADGTGHATLTVPGITFAPKHLQPEALTPLTLGVVANVAGTVTGAGRIDWSAAGVTSTGDFGTDRLDLAAAFGPVAGIKTRIHFTDLLGLVTAPHQEAAIVEINPGVAVADGVAHFQLVPGQRVRVEDATWPFAGGTLKLEPTTLDFAAEAERHMTFRIDGLDAAAFVQQLDFPNMAATGRFDGVLPMTFDKSGGTIAGGNLTARKGGGTLAYIGQLSQEQLGTMGKLAFDALKAIRYSALTIRFDGKLDGEMISQVQFTGVREATPDQSLVARMIRNLPFRFNIRIQAPFRGLMGTARAYQDPRILLNQATPAEPPIQHSASAAVR